ncbi:MAG: chromosome segregation protein SMC, partial [Chthoniobacterales bacterium]
MHLHSLELVGFKSFADKTTFEFHEGVTAIVGPNGCGKSNVLDAVRWVLGEQSAKALRGGEMADVIFNGTDSRKPVGFGEVSLTFTNCSSELGVDWHDVRVTRRVYRDGNSEYFLNKTLCRLRDIQSLFADTGVGRSAYSIMEQGKIDLILSSRPEDRRAVFEEAAGITKYKTQKREALRKLEATEANLLRIGDIIKEVKRQIGSLQRQAGKARRYQTLHADLLVLDTHYSRGRLADLEAELARAADEINRHEKALHTSQTAIERTEDSLSDERLELSEIDSRISEGRAEANRLQSAIAGHRSRIEFNRQRAEELIDLIERHRSDILAAETKRSQQATQIQEADALVEKTNRLLETKQQELAQWSEKATTARRDRTTHEAALQGLRLAVSRLEDRISHFGDELAGARSRRDATVARIDVLGAAIDEASAARDTAAAAVAAGQAALDREQQKLQAMLAEAEAAEAQLREHQTTLAGAERAVSAAERIAAEKQSRLEILRQLNEEGEGLAAGSQAVLKGLHAPEKIGPALGGALASRLNVDREFIPALEAAFGRNMHAVVLQDAELAPEIFRVLTEEKQGQAALALPALTVNAALDATPQLPEGTLGWAIDKVDVPEDLAALVRHLLRRVALVPDLATALRLKKTAPALQFATVAGEFVSAEGVVFGGAASAQAESLLQRGARINALIGEHVAASAEHGEFVRGRDLAKAAMEAAVTALAEIRERHQKAQIDHTAAQVQLAALHRDLHEAERKFDTLEIEGTTLAQQIEAADARIAELQNELHEQRSALAAQTARKTEAERELEISQVAEEQAVRFLDEVRLAVATERQRQENLLSQRQPMTAREAELA